MAARRPHFITCAPGVEAVLHREARALRLPRLERQVGGVAFEGNRADAWRANLWLRTAIRVLERVARFPATDSDALYAGAGEVPWEEFLSPAGTLLVDARSNSSSLDHTRFIEQRVKDAIVDRFQRRAGTRPSVDKDDPDLRINAHLFKDRVTLSVDTSGHSLHKRGWRRTQGRAPLAETTAAALVLLSEWDRRAPLLDPFVGSGTLLVEAALVAANRAPGLTRSFGFERWPGHDAPSFARFKEEARGEERPLGKRRFFGADRDPERVRDALANAAAVGFEDCFDCQTREALDFAPRAGWNACILTNPPYGVRVGEADELYALYRDFGILLRERCAGYRLGLLSGDARLRKKLGFRGAPLFPLVHGGLSCEFLMVECIRP